jgi:Flp pilus assembly protein TadG
MPINCGNRRGNTVIEAAVILVPLLAIIFAIFDYSFVIFLRSTFMYAAREGARYAITYQTANGMGHDASIREVVKQNALGFLNGVTGAENPCRICIRYYDPVSFAFTNANTPGNVVEVSVENYGVNWAVPLMRGGGTLTLQGRASDRMEGLPPGGTAPAR